MMDTDVVLVHAFSDAINARDLARLEALMHPEHRFVDTAGTTVSGRPECLAAWAAFFTSFPDYRNVLERIDVVVPRAGHRHRVLALHRRAARRPSHLAGRRCGRFDPRMARRRFRHPAAERLLSGPLGPGVVAG